jgi:predicted amidohydrolase YtcJ
MKATNHLKFMALTLSMLFMGCSTKYSHDIVIKNGNIFNSKTNLFEKMNIGLSEGKIITISKDELSALEVVDANGQFVYPGFIDAHCHFLGFAKFSNAVNLVGTGSVQEVIERTKAFKNENPQMRFIVGRGWDQNDWENKEFPTNEQLNEAFPDIPVLLVRIDGHAALLNEAALQLAGQLPEQVAGGQIVRINGQPTGVLIDKAQSLVSIPEPSREEIIVMLQRAEKDCLAMGLTGLADAGLDRWSILLIDSLQKAGALKMPIYAMITDNPKDYNPFLKSGPLKTERLNVRSIKVYGDGALGSRGALLLEDYSDSPGHRGLQLKSQKDLEELCQIAKNAGFQVNVHAIGDSANRLVLKTFSNTLGANNDLRWRVEHAQVINPADVHYFKDYGIIPSIQPTHATSDMYWAEERLGSERIAHGYIYKQLLEATGTIALGTDFPVEDIDPRKTFYAAVFRQDAEGFPDGGFLPQERLTREQTLQGMTLWAAFAQFEESEKGSIETGKWADFFFSKTNLLTCKPQEVLNAEVTRTIIHGETVYKQ